MDYRPPFTGPGTASYSSGLASPGFNLQSPLVSSLNRNSYTSSLDRILQPGPSYTTSFGVEEVSGPSKSEDVGTSSTAKRGSKACVACRRGKNRCEPDPDGSSKSCRRCLANGIPCVFEKPSDRARHRHESVGGSDIGATEGRVSQLERTVQELSTGQGHIQGTLNRILALLPQPYLANDGAVPTASIFNSLSPPSAFGSMASPHTGTNRVAEFPKLPGFKPPNHQFGTYGVLPPPSAPPSPTHSRHSRSSSSHSAASDSALPQGSMTAPIQALEALANAANQAAGPEEGKRKRKQVTIDGKSVHMRVRKKTRPDPTPRNPFPDVVTKGLVAPSEARELWDLFFTGCHYFLPLWDKEYDTYETFIERTPFSTNGLLAVAAKIRAGNGPPGQSFQRCLEEAQGIARSTLFGPIVRKEAAMAMLILSVWSQNAWLPCGHALRMALDMNLHRALDKLFDATEHSMLEQRDLIVSARIWMNCYTQDQLVSLGTGKPMLLRDDSSVRKARLILSHMMTSETDIRLVASVELVNLRVRILEHLGPLHGRVDSQTVSFVRRTFSDLQEWHREWHGLHRQRFEEGHVLLSLLEAELVHAQLWTICVALRGVHWDKLAGDQRELAFQAKDAAARCLEIYLRSENFRKHLKFATHDQLVSVAFAAVFLLKIAILYPQAVALPSLISQVSEVAHMLSSECYAERYALTLRLMLSSLRRKTGAVSTMPGTPKNVEGGTMSTLTVDGAVGALNNGLESFLNLPAEDGSEWPLQPMDNFTWPTEFSPSSLPVWLQDGNFADLGLPADGSDSLFLAPELASMFMLPADNSGGLFALPDSADVGAEAW